LCNKAFLKAKSYPELRRPIRSKFVKLTPPDLPEISGDSVLRVEWTPSGDLVTVEDYLKTGMRAVVQNSGWLKDQFQKHGFEHLLQINTCTLFSAGQMVTSVMKQNGISSAEAERVDFAAQHLANLRRNRDLHCYFGEETLIRTYYGESDLIDIYIPVVNKLIHFFHQKPS
jgi:hypothetical protein